MEIWTEENVGILKELYPTTRNKDLVVILGLEVNQKNINSLTRKAFRLNLKKIEPSGHKKHEWLTSDDLETFYWIGFLFADGCFSKNGSIEVSLSVKDVKHLEKLASKTKSNIGYRKCGGHCYVSFSDRDSFRIIRDKFDIKKRKTYNPPDITKWNFTDDQLIALFIGFIDGDGHFRKNNKSIEIENHSSWFEFYEFFTKVFLKKFDIETCKPRINKRGYCKMYINKTNSKKLLDFVIENNLPVNDRKWNVLHERG